MFSRRKFLTNSALASIGLAVVGCQNEEPKSPVVASTNTATAVRPLVISTWDIGLKANIKAWEVLSGGGRALDAVEQGVMVIEADENNTTVGIGGTPDRDGHVTLDACIMDENGNAGSVCFLEDIKHPISVARKVMEETPHVILSGEGALQFAVEQGFERQNLLTEKGKTAWEKWQKEKKYEPVINIENHDTIGMLAIDKNGNISGSCTTSGLGYKMRGRVGDSPIIGAGLYVDNEIGGAVATGLGEMVLKSLSTFLVVELMRNGKSPQEACEEAIQRIIKKNANHKDFQVGICAVNKNGEIGAASIHGGFSYAIHTETQEELVKANYTFAQKKKEKKEKKEE